MADDSNQLPNMQPPDGWGTDELTKFQSYAQNNEFALFEDFKEAYGLLIMVDAYTYEAAKFAIMHAHHKDNARGYLLFINANNHLRASVRLLAAGQCLSVYPVGRAALESALYGWLLLSEDGADELWQNRPSKKDKGASNVWNNTFQFSNISRKVKVINPEIGEMLKALHQLAIDFGAHPNVDALNSNLNFKTSEDGHSQIEHIFLHQRGAVFSLALKFHLETGITILELIAMAAPDFERLMLISNKIAELKHAYHQLMNMLQAEVRG